MSGQLHIRGGALAQASAAFRQAGSAFADSGTVSTGADYGDGELAAAVSAFESACFRVASGFGSETAGKSTAASQTGTSFARLDAQIAARTTSA